MNIGLACFGLSPTHLAVIGLLYPPELADGEHWSIEDGATFRNAARQLWQKWPSTPELSWYHTARAQIIANRQEPNWWPSACTQSGLDGSYMSAPIDLSLPVTWGIGWLRERIDTIAGTTRNPASDALLTIEEICDRRLDHLRCAAVGGFPPGELPSLDEACQAAGRKIGKLGPIFLFPEW